jgi:hypothetical protein
MTHRIHLPTQRPLERSREASTMGLRAPYIRAVGEDSADGVVAVIDEIRVQDE